MKGGRDCRNPAIGRQVIGYFGWPASPISLLGEDGEKGIEEGALTNYCETGPETVSCTWVQGLIFRGPKNDTEREGVCCSSFQPQKPPEKPFSPSWALLSLGEGFQGGGVGGERRTSRIT